MLKRFIEAEQLTMEEVMAEAGPTPDEIEAFCQECGALNLPCLHRRVWLGDGLLKHCPTLRTFYGGNGDAK